MRVQAFGPYNIDIELITDLATVNKYWDGVSKFLSDIGNKITLSHGQQRWLEKIANDYEKQHGKLCQ